MTKAQASKTTTPSKPSSLAEIADELGSLEKEYALAIAPFEMKLPRMKALKEALQAACPAKADAEWIVEGARYGVRLGPRANERSINFPKLVKAIGAAAFAKFATCTLGALAANIGASVGDSVVTTAQTGVRKLSTFEKGALEKAA